MATKRSTAAKKAARTRARRKAKRSAAAKKAAETRKRTTTRTRTRRSRRRNTGRPSGGAGFGGAVVNGLGFAVGAALFTLLAWLLFAPVGDDEQTDNAATNTPAVDTTGLSAEDAATLETTVALYSGNAGTSSTGGGCQCWEC